MPGLLWSEGEAEGRNRDEYVQHRGDDESGGKDHTSLVLLKKYKQSKKMMNRQRTGQSCAVCSAETKKENNTMTTGKDVRLTQMAKTAG